MSTEIVETELEPKAEHLPEIGVQYLGDGSSYIEGVPARDLTREEWDRMREDLRALALATGLYNDPLAGSEPIKPEGVGVEPRDEGASEAVNGVGRPSNPRRSRPNSK